MAKRVTILGRPDFSPARQSTSTVTFSVVLNELPSSDVTVSFTVGSLFGAVSNLTFTTSNWNVPQSVTFTPVVSPSGFFGANKEQVLLKAIGGGYNWFEYIDLYNLDSNSDYRLNQAHPLFISSTLLQGQSIPTVRTNLIAEVFNGNGLSTQDTPDAETIGYTGAMHQTNTTAITGFSSVNKLTFNQVDRLGYNWYSISYHIFNSTPNGKLCFVHSGHGSESGHVNMIQDLLNGGYDVMYMAMPCVLDNTTDNPSITGSGVNAHNDIASSGLDNGTWNPLFLFFDDKVKAMNYLKANYAYTAIGFTGCSGGGLTAAWMGAVDERFDTIISLRGITNTESSFVFDDYEQGGGNSASTNLITVGFSAQQVVDTYKIASETDLFVMSGSSNRSVYQYHNIFDSCCHRGYDWQILRDIVTENITNYHLTIDTNSAYSAHSFNVPDRALVLTAMNAL